jgi:hypothetical protein
MSLILILLAGRALSSQLFSPEQTSMILTGTSPSVARAFLVPKMGSVFPWVWKVWWAKLLGESPSVWKPPGAQFPAKMTGHQECEGSRHVTGIGFHVGSFPE